MSRADDLRGKLAKTTTKTSEKKSVSTENNDTGPQPHPEPVRGKPVRITVDLPPSRHDDMKRWTLDTARELGRTRITAQDLVNTLVHRMLSDETLAQQVKDDLRHQ